MGNDPLLPMGGAAAVSSEQPLEIALFAGEYSGDVQGAALAAALLGLWGEGVRGDGVNRSRHQVITPSPHQSLRLWGMGGSRMRQAGVKVRFDSTHWGAMGTYEALKLAPRLLRVLARVKRELLDRRPEVLVLIDFGAFNARLAAWARQEGMKVFYYFPPGSWRRGPIRPGPRSLPTIADRIATPFPWSAAALREAGADAHFVGHPLLDIAQPAMSPAAFRQLHDLPADARLICHLPGSRRHELRYNWPAMRGAARQLSERLPDLRHVLALAPSVSIEAARDLAPAVRLRPPATVYDALSACDLAITKSGTVTLEAAILGRPMVILYRGSRIQEVEYYLLHRRRIRFIGMPNIILDRIAFPELIQHAASPEGIAAAALPLLTDPEARRTATEALAAVRGVLGEPGAVTRTATLILDLMAGRDRDSEKWGVNDGAPEQCAPRAAHG
jgi:lipid-A-disaccharide synthase